MTVIFARFQFQTGSIKSVSILNPTWVVPVMFQFQTGSIKSAFFPGQGHIYFLFQFQTGSIKRTSRPKPNYPAEERFNSKLVRLKANAMSGA